MVTLDQILADPRTAPATGDFAARYAVAVMLAEHMCSDNVAAIQCYLERLGFEHMILTWGLALCRDDSLAGTPEFRHNYAPKYAALYRTSCN